MQKTRLKEFTDSFFFNIYPFISDSWRKRSLLLLSLLGGFYLTNSIISFLLDKSINTILIAIIILLIMELVIRSLLFSSSPKLSIFVLVIN